MKPKWSKKVVCLNNESLNAQMQYYLDRNFLSDSVSYIGQGYESHKIYYSYKNEFDIELNFSFQDTDQILDLLRELAPQVFKFAKTLSHEALDEGRVDEFVDKILLTYNNYVSYLEEPSKQNTIDLLTYIVSCLVQQHILLNGNKRSIFSFMVLFLRQFCGLYLLWTDQVSINTKSPNLTIYSQTVADWVVNNKNPNLEQQIKDFILKHSVIFAPFNW